MCLPYGVGKIETLQMVFGVVLPPEHTSISVSCPLTIAVVFITWLLLLVAPSARGDFGL